MNTIEYSCGHQVVAHSGQAMPMQCACGMGEIVGAKGRFYIDDPVRANLRGAMMNATQINADPMINEPKPTEEQLGVPDWTKAHKDATHWDSHMWRFCNEFGYFGFRGEFCLLDTHRWGTDRYTPRPVGSDKASDWNGTGLPPVGTKCEVLDSVNGKWHGIEITSVAREHLVALFNGEEALLKKNCHFRPIRTQAQRERDDLLTSIIEDYRKSLNSPVSTIELNLISEFSSYLYDAGMLRRAGE